MTAKKLPIPAGMLWVAFMPDGFPCGVMNPSHTSGDDPAKAAKEFWETTAGALQHLTAGYRLELVPRERWRNELMAIHLGDVPWTGSAA
jgi:hypothetical protein